MHSCFSSALALVGLTAEMQAGFALFSSILQSSVTRFRLFNEYELIQKIINFFTILLLDSYISFFFFCLQAFGDDHEPQRSSQSQQGFFVECIPYISVASFPVSF